MDDEIARLRAHHIEDLRPIAMTLDAVARELMAPTPMGG